MKKFKIIPFLASLLLVIVLLAGCGANGGESNEEQGTDTPAAEAPQGQGGKAEPTQEPDPLADLKLKAEKVGSFSQKDIVFRPENICYQKDNKIGFLSYDGKTDTGAKYADGRILENGYCAYVLSDPEQYDFDDPSTLNTFGLLSPDCEELLPAKYATFTQLNERYFYVSEANGITTDEAQGVMHIEKEDKTITYYTGTWSIYDVVDKKFVEGATGTAFINAIKAYGNWVQYATGDTKVVVVNHKGIVLPEGGKAFTSGWYALDIDTAGAVYDENQNKQFDYELDGFIPYDCNGEYIMASKDDNGYKYVLMDKTGKIISSEFSEEPEFYGDLIYADKKLCDVKGAPVIDGTFEKVYYDEQLGKAWTLKNENTYTVIKKDGTVLFRGEEGGAVSFDFYSNFLLRKEAEDSRLYYCFKDKDYTIKGSSYAPWVIEVSKANDIDDLVDTISGETLIKGYENYHYITVPGSCLYVYAINTNGGCDIYRIQ